MLALRHKLQAISHGARGLVYTEHQVETLQISEHKPTFM